MSALPVRNFADDETVLKKAAERAIRYQKSLDTRRVGPTSAALERTNELGGSLPAEGCDAHQVIAQLDQVGSEAVTANACGRYFGFQR